jgi:hypothetical protein
VDLLAVQGGLSLLIELTLLFVKAFASSTHCAVRLRCPWPQTSRPRTCGCCCSASALVAAVLLPGAFGLINLVGTVAALVYLADVRPAVRALTPRR